MIVYYLDRDDVLTAGAAAIEQPLTVRDFGLLDAAIARPQSTVFGIDAYPDLYSKGAALLHSIARNLALVDGNKRTAWAAAWVFLGANGIFLSETFNVDHAEQFMNDVATEDGDVNLVAQRLRLFAG